jgi:hypothetical protein
MADTAKVNGFGLSDAELQKLVDRDRKAKEKNLRNRVGHKLLMAKVRTAGLVVTDAEIDAEIAKMKK